MIIQRSDLMSMAFALVEANALRAHERTDDEHLRTLTAQIQADGHLREPVLVDRATLVILDGHHRTAALRSLGCALIPAYLVDYDDPRVTVGSWRDALPLSKAQIRRRGLDAELLAPKTSKHSLGQHICPRPIPLSALRTVPAVSGG